MNIKPKNETGHALEGAHPEERAAFRFRLLANPNYYGNLVGSTFKARLPIKRNTHYEELACVGYHPQQRRLDAVVHVKQPSGYGTGICGAGTSEFVRFYLSFDGGNTWHDQGLTSFQAYDIPQGTERAKRLEYAVSLPVRPRSALCMASPLIQARAILSWNFAPPPNQPDWQPVWGNVREAAVVVEPLRRYRPWQVLEAAKVDLSPSIKDLLDVDVPIEVKPKLLGTAQLQQLYRDRDVPVHRFAHRALLSVVSAKGGANAETLATLLPGIAIDPDIFGLLFPKTDGNTSYEELKCIGLDPNMPDTLVGIVQVKKTLGYSGGPCTGGSREYVSFWADFNDNGTFETHLGAADVRVYDVHDMGAAGAYYAVRLPVNLNPYRRPCHEGPRVVRIRAILSWNMPVPSGNPNQVPTWGNREETLINIAPQSGTAAGRIAILGGIPVGYIVDGPISVAGAGLTTADAVFATNNLAPDPTLHRPCPFAGRVAVQGLPVVGSSYCVEVSPDGNLWTPVLRKLEVVDQYGNVSSHSADAVTKRFAYLPFDKNTNNLLAEWDSTGDDAWYVRLTVYDAAGIMQGAPDLHVIQLDNTGPQASIAVTTGSGDCGKFKVGDTLFGDFVARDTYLAGYSLGVEPLVNAPGVGVPSPSSGSAGIAPAPGDQWHLDTNNMRPCGYVIRVVATDRAIVNSQAVGHSTSASAGFCLEEPT